MRNDSMTAAAQGGQKDTPTLDTESMKTHTHTHTHMHAQTHTHTHTYTHAHTHAHADAHTRTHTHMHTHTHAQTQKHTRRHPPSSLLPLSFGKYTPSESCGSASEIAAMAGMRSQNIERRLPRPDGACVRACVRVVRGQELVVRCGEVWCAGAGHKRGGHG